MKTPLFFLSWAFLAATGFAQTRHDIGSAAVMDFACPSVFFVGQESGDTVFLVPRKNDKDSPISMRITCFRDARKEGVDEATVKEFLKEFNKTEKLYKEGNNWYSTAAANGSDPAGIKWLYQIFVISADGYVLNATVQTIDGREKEAQCKELWDAVPKMIQSIKRKGGGQAGADPPATAPQLKSDGKEKPKPKSEVRPK